MSNEHLPARRTRPVLQFRSARLLPWIFAAKTTSVAALLLATGAAHAAGPTQAELNNYAAVTRPYAFKDKTAARDYFTKLSGLYKNLNYAAAGSNDFQRIAKAIEDLDKSVPTIAANVATPGGSAAASRHQ